MIVVRLLAAVMCCALGSQPAVAGLSREYSVKLAFLYKFANYVENTQMPSRDHITIGILGDDPFGRTLDAVAAKRKARGKTLRIVRFADSQHYQPCDILFVSRSSHPEQLQELIQVTAGDGVLIVGEHPQFTKLGGIMNFYIDASGKTAIQLNVDAAQARRLRIDARLMRVCEIVSTAGHTP